MSHLSRDVFVNFIPVKNVGGDISHYCEESPIANFHWGLAIEKCHERGGKIFKILLNRYFLTRTPMSIIEGMGKNINCVVEGSKMQIL